MNFGFNRGAELTKSQLKLFGIGKLIRHITVRNFETFPKNEIKQLLSEAIGLLETINPELINSKTQAKSIVMSISEKKRRPTN